MQDLRLRKSRIYVNFLESSGPAPCVDRKASQEKRFRQSACFLPRHGWAMSEETLSWNSSPLPICHYASMNIRVYDHNFQSFAVCNKWFEGGWSVNSAQNNAKFLDCLDSKEDLKCRGSGGMKFVLWHYSLKHKPFWNTYSVTFTLLKLLRFLIREESF